MELHSVRERDREKSRHMEVGVIPIPTLDGVLQFRLNGVSKLVGLPQAGQEV